MNKKHQQAKSPEHPAASAPVPGNAVPDEMGGANQREKLRQPHERDESPDNGKRGTDRSTDQPRRRIPQAHEDIERGVVDSERRGVPSDVPDSRDNRSP